MCFLVIICDTIIIPFPFIAYTTAVCRNCIRLIKGQTKRAGTARTREWVSEWEREIARESLASHSAPVPVRALDGRVIRLEVSVFVNLWGSDRRLHALLSPVVSFSGGRGEWSRFYIDVHRGISPLFFLQWIPAGYEPGCFCSCCGRTVVGHRSFRHSSCK